jgi:hypothetical protein
MAHVRQQIRNQVATTITGLATGATVYKMRKFSLDDSALPALVVYSNDEVSNLVTVGTRTLNRSVTIVIEVIALGSSTSVFDTIDTMCAEVETAVANDFTVGGLAKSAILRRTDTDVNTDGDKAIGVATMNFEVQYVTSIGDAETAR